MNFIPFSILATIGLTIYMITKALTDYYLRKKMVEKGLVGDDAIKILSKELQEVNKYASLKWGLIVLFAGIGLVIIELGGGFTTNSSLPFGILSICISLGFLIYYFIVRRIKQN